MVDADDTKSDAAGQIVVGSKVRLKSGAKTYTDPAAVRFPFHAWRLFGGGRNSVRRI